MSTIWLIAQRELRTRLLSKASLISAAVMLVVIVGGMFAVSYFQDRDAAPESIGVTPSAAALLPGLTAYGEAGGSSDEFVEVDDDDPAQVIDGDLAAIVTGTPDAPQIVADGSADDLRAAVQQVAGQQKLAAAISGLGGDPEQIQADLGSITVEVTQTGDDDEFDGGSYFAYLLVSGVLLFVLVQACSVIMMGVVEEKVSRVVEILLASVRPSQLMGGKVLGVGLYSVIHAALMMVPLVVSASVFGILDDIDIDVASTVGMFVVWFGLGFALYAVLFGGLAALVSRQEDIGAITTPMIILLMAPFYLGIYLVPGDPDGIWTKVLSQVPFFSPFMIPARQAFGGIQTWELALSVVLCLVAIPVLIWVGGRVYSRAVLNTGGRMKLKDALK